MIKELINRIENGLGDLTSCCSCGELQKVNAFRQDPYGATGSLIDKVVSLLDRAGV